MSQFIIVTTTLPTQSEAQILSKLSIEKKLAACAQISSPIESVYRWNNKIETSTEYILSLKTTQSLYKKLELFIIDHHPYDVPEIIVTEIKQGLKSYLNWIKEETS